MALSSCIGSVLLFEIPIVSTSFEKIAPYHLLSNGILHVSGAFASVIWYLSLQADRLPNLELATGYARRCSHILLKLSQNS